ncbi:hypothetical protein BDP27DRAFT_329035 [Rhodocollybia butyracea]|uniref:Uncharacterized protein n=1 Tax=Rhodocollybia butyracea TaxID=206335 RepID=A0A9P5QBC3_9AGAR|nr:hypothetical protein BDP27DRAFT_365910 [Rhodocollybia butyracea]KAF9077877.1 hypothetical protein BDP27DRAFT_329035 [Rhodocollybia butyracea]
MFDEEGKTKKDTGLLFYPSAVPNPSNSTMIARYISMFHLAPRVIKLTTENGSMVEGSVKSASDYSYSAPRYAGPGFRVAWDAEALIPFSLKWGSFGTRLLPICCSQRSVFTLRGMQ